MSPIWLLHGLHAFDLVWWVRVPVDLGLLILFRPNPSRSVAFQGLEVFAALIRVFQIDAWHHGDFVPPFVPQVLAEKLRLTLEAFPRVATPERNLPIQDGLCSEGNGTIPAAEDLEREVGAVSVPRFQIVPEQIPCLVRKGQYGKTAGSVRSLHSPNSCLRVF